MYFESGRGREREVGGGKLSTVVKNTMRRGERGENNRETGGKMNEWSVVGHIKLCFSLSSAFVRDLEENEERFLWMSPCPR